MRYLTEKEQDELYEKFNEEFAYKNLVAKVGDTGDLTLYRSAFNMKNRPYKLFSIDERALNNAKWENAFNDVVKTVVREEIYRIDYFHAWSIFNPSEIKEDDDLCFPNGDEWFYYPNGDEYFFLPKDFSYGIFTLPPNAMIVFGEKLIAAIEKNKEKLLLTEIDDECEKLKEIQEKLSKINEYVKNLGWFDFQLKKIEQNKAKNFEYEIELRGGFDIDLQGYEMLKIVFKNVEFVSANLSIRYEWTVDNKQPLVNIVSDEQILQKFPQLETGKGQFMFQIWENSGEESWAAFSVYAEDVEFEIVEGIKK